MANSLTEVRIISCSENRWVFTISHSFSIELYIDKDKKSYNDLGFKRFGFMGLFPAILSSAARAAQSRMKVRIINFELICVWEGGGTIHIPMFFFLIRLLVLAATLQETVTIILYKFPNSINHQLSISKILGYQNGGAIVVKGGTGETLYHVIESWNVY